MHLDFGTWELAVPGLSFCMACDMMCLPGNHHIDKGDWIMVDTRIILSGLWVAVMLTYLWGDVLRIMAGDVEPGKLMAGMPATQGMLLLIAIIMLVPIIMVVLTLTIPYPAIRWVNIIVAILVVVFNLLGLPYKGAYDNFLIVVSFVFNALTVWYAWKW
jgi:hypothetical protein